MKCLRKIANCLIKPKQLRWELFGKKLIAHTYFGYYYIMSDDIEPIYILYFKDEIIGKFESETKAKNSAQESFNNRIKWSLD